MAAKLKLLWTFLDVPSGAIMGVYTGSMVLMTWILLALAVVHFAHTGEVKVIPFPDGSVAAYLGVVGAYTGYGMMKKGKEEAVVSPDA
jgi:hypothetical protein